MKFIKEYRSNASLRSSQRALSWSGRSFRNGSASRARPGAVHFEAAALAARRRSRAGLRNCLHCSRRQQTAWQREGNPVQRALIGHEERSNRWMKSRLRCSCNAGAYLKQAMISTATGCIAEGTRSDVTWQRHFPQCPNSPSSHCNAGAVASAGMHDLVPRRSTHAEALSADRAD